MTSIKELILEIKKRPRSFLGKKSIFCLKAYLDGWSYGVSPKDILIMNDFQDWVGNYYQQKGRGFHKIICFYSQDESDALDHFFELFDLFLKEKGDIHQK